MAPKVVNGYSDSGICMVEQIAHHDTSNPLSSSTVHEKVWLFSLKTPLLRMTLIAQFKSNTSVQYHTYNCLGDVLPYGRQAESSWVTGILPRRVVRCASPRR